MKKKFLALFGTLLLVFVLGLSTTSLGLTVSEVETLTRSALNDYLQARGSPNFNWASQVGDMSGISYLLNQNAWAQKKQDIPFENYDSFTWHVWVTGTTLQQTHVILQLFNDLDFTITADNYWYAGIPVNIINCTTNNQDTITSYRFVTGNNNNTFSFDNSVNGSLTTTINRTNYSDVLYTTGEIYNTQNLLFFGGKLNRLTPLEFQPHFVNTTTYKNTSVNYTIGDFYKINEVMLGTIIPNDAKLYNCYLYDGDIIIGAYTYNFYSNTQLYSNALRGSNNKVYCYTRYLDYDKIYNIEIEYYYDNDDTLHIAHDNIVFFAQRKCSKFCWCYFFRIWRFYNSR